MSDNIQPWQYVCSRCQKVISFDRRGKARGWCAKCEVASWTPDRQRAMARVITAAMRGDREKVLKLADEAMKHIPKKPHD